ncbi:hypothetical protein [Streptomyces antibioticus]
MGKPGTRAELGRRSRRSGLNGGGGSGGSLPLVVMCARPAATASVG